MRNTINIFQHKGKVTSMTVTVTYWDKLGEDDFLSIDVPMLHIKTFAKNLEDIEKSISESIKLFVINATHFGNGVESELTDIGWIVTGRDENSIQMEFGFDKSISIIEEILETGETIVETLELEYV